MYMVYIVEDDENLREIIRYSLVSADYEVCEFEDGISMFKGVEASVPSLFILDIMLPGEDGFDILRKLKKNKSTAEIPVIILTAKSGEMDRVKGLDYGADDYITKPFSVLELLARVRAVLRRTTKEDSENSEIFTVGKLVVDILKHSVTIDENEVPLTYKEFELLHILIKNAGYVLTRNLLMDKVWGFEYEGESRTVDVHIRTLRQKLGECGDYIKTVRGVGYKFEEV